LGLQLVALFFIFIYKNVYKVPCNGNQTVVGILSTKLFKSIYIGGCSMEVFEYLSKNTNNNLESLRVSEGTDFNMDFGKNIGRYKSLINLDLTFCSNNKVANILSSDFIIGNKMLRKINVNSEYVNDEGLLDIFKDNYTLINCTINNKCSDKIENIMIRNRKYKITILLCMNRRIIPRCVFKNMILINL